MTQLLIQDADEEIKRADHLLHISLKYTRTRDIVKNILARLIAAFELVITAVLEDADSKKKLGVIPDNWKTRAQMIQKLKPKSKEFIELYFLLKKLDDGSYTAREEFRKHITVIFDVAGKKIEVDVPMLTEYFKKTKEFLKYIEGELG